MPSPAAVCSALYTLTRHGCVRVRVRERERESCEFSSFAVDSRLQRRV